MPSPFKRLDITNITIPYEIDNTQGPRYTKGVLATFGNKLDRKEIHVNIYTYLKIKSRFCTPATYIHTHTHIYIVVAQMVKNLPAMQETQV